VDVICLQNKNEKRREVNSGVNIYRIPLKRSRKGISRYLYEYIVFFCRATIKLCSLYFRNRYDFIQVNTLPDFLVFATIIPKIFGAKVTIDLHEPAPELFGTLFGEDRKVLINLVKFIEQISIRYVDRAITVSEQMKNNYIKRGASPSKMKVVLNVPNLEFNPDLYNGDLQRGDNKFSLVCHGAMLKRYGQDVAIKAIEIVKEEIPNIELNILGYGEYEFELKKLTAKLKLYDYVYFYGFIPFLDMVKMIAKTDLGIVPIEKNSYSDLVHTNKMFEFIAMKKPVIISRTKAVQDFFGSDDSCLKYFESGDEKDLASCIIELYNNADQRKRMVENAFEKFKLFHWEIAKEDYCQIYDKLLTH
jgi:glycosyltransferase involved in cell wall biosynthesis